MNVPWPLARPLLHALDPERAHDLTLRALAVLPLPAPAPDDPRLTVEAFGLRFANPVGLAAGFDKTGAIAHKAGALGFGFTEIGTLTPLAQPGNPKPRLFRLPEHDAVINRFGFNNRGHAHALAHLRKGGAVLGVNIGANKDAVDRTADYVAGIRAFVETADYSRSTSPRRTRRACATCKNPRRSTSFWPACSTRATPRPRCSAASRCC